MTTENTLEADFRAFLEDSLGLALDAFLAELNLPEHLAVRLGKMERPEVEALLAALSPEAERGLVRWAELVARVGRVRAEQREVFKWPTK